MIYQITNNQMRARDFQEAISTALLQCGVKFENTSTFGGKITTSGGLKNHISFAYSYIQPITTQVFIGISLDEEDRIKEYFLDFGKLLTEEVEQAKDCYAAIEDFLEFAKDFKLKIISIVKDIPNYMVLDISKEV